MVWLFAAAGHLLYPDDLGFPQKFCPGCENCSWRPPEPSWSAARRAVARRRPPTPVSANWCADRGMPSPVSLEDPIEVAVDGVAQSQVHATAGFDLATGLRSLMRQDPEAIFVGEIRDCPTAEAVFQAALTGHLVLTTFHAGSAAARSVVSRTWGSNPTSCGSGILGIISQRLVRRLCDCPQDVTNEESKLGCPCSALAGPVVARHASRPATRVASYWRSCFSPSPRTWGGPSLSQRCSATRTAGDSDRHMATLWQRACQAAELRLYKSRRSPARFRFRRRPRIVNPNVAGIDVVERNSFRYGAVIHATLDCGRGNQCAVISQQAGIRSVEAAFPENGMNSVLRFDATIE